MRDGRATMADDGEKAQPRPETDESGRGAAGDPPEVDAGRQGSDQERLRQAKEELQRLRVVDLVRGVMVDLMAIGYEKLGLTDETRTLRNLDDVRVTIESLRRLIEVLEGEGLVDDVRTFRSTLATLQLAYARVAADTGAPETAVAEPAKAEAQDEAQARVSAVEEEVAGAAAPRSGADKRAPRPAGGTGAKKPTAKKPTAKKPVRKAAKKPSAKGAARKRPAGGRGGGRG
jgi:hypothetical protein